MHSPTVQLNDGNIIPQIGFGSCFLGAEVANTVAHVRTALEVGYRHIDTAKGYTNDAEVGEAVRTSCIARSDITVTSKLFCDEHGYEQTLTAYDAALKRMGLDYLDLYLIHWPNPALGLYVDSWRAMIRLREEGRVRSIGVSNFEPEHIDRLIRETGVTPAINQVEVNPQFQQHGLRAAMKQRGIQVESWGPTGHGRILAEPTCAAIARKHGRSTAQIVLRWHLQEGMLLIPKAEKREWMEENLRITDFALDADDLGLIRGLDGGEAGRSGPHPDSSLESRLAMMEQILAAVAAENNA